MDGHFLVWNFRRRIVLTFLIWNCWRGHQIKIFNFFRLWNFSIKKRGCHNSKSRQIMTQIEIFSKLPKFSKLQPGTIFAFSKLGCNCPDDPPSFIPHRTIRSLNTLPRISIRPFPSKNQKNGDLNYTYSVLIWLAIRPISHLLQYFLRGTILQKMQTFG
jgi:hypothetical protein